MSLSLKQKRQLRTARRRLDRKERWIKGDWSDAGRYCLLGAIGHQAHLSRIDLAEIHNHVLNAIKTCGYLELGCWAYSSISAFNDLEQRQHRHIIRVLDRAIETA